jgi:hypothetical protein
MSTIEELLRRKSSGSGPENREYSSKDPLPWPRYTLYPQKLEVISPTRGGLLVGVVRWRIQATELSFFNESLSKGIYSLLEKLWESQN